MNSAILIKLVAGGVAVLAIAILALVGKVDGPAAVSAIQWVVVTFLGGTALIGSAQAVATGGVTAARLRADTEKLYAEKSNESPK